MERAAMRKAESEPEFKVSMVGVEISNPEFQCAQTITYLKKGFDPETLLEINDCVLERSRKFTSSDSRKRVELERILFSQVQTLNVMFHENLRLAASRQSTNLGPVDVSSLEKLALRAQEQCRKTVLAIGALGNNRQQPRVQNQTTFSTNNYSIVVNLSPICEPILELMRDRNQWKGSTSELLIALTSHATQNTLESGDWPSTPTVFKRQLNKLIPELEKAGIVVQQATRRTSAQPKQLILQKLPSE
jgi:hypothetical protein